MKINNSLNSKNNNNSESLFAKITDKIKYSANLLKSATNYVIQNPGKVLTLSLAAQSTLTNGQSVSFTQRTGSSNPFNSINCGTSYGGAALGDLNGDGYIDLLCVGGATGNFRYYTNNVAGTFTQTTTPSGLSSVQGDVPIIADFNGDGKPDIVVGHYSGNSVYNHLYYFLNTGTATSPAFSLQNTAANNPFYSFTYNSVSVPGLYVNNGLNNVVVGDSSSNAPVYLQNIGTSANPQFSKQTGSSNPFDLGGAWDSNTFKAISTGSFIDNSGSTTTLAFETFSGTSVRTAQGNSDGSFTDITGTANDPFTSKTIGTSGYIRSSIGDVNNDGKPDVIFQDNGGTVYYFENTTSTPILTTSSTSTTSSTELPTTSSTSTTSSTELPTTSSTSTTSSTELPTTSSTSTTSSTELPTTSSTSTTSSTELPTTSSTSTTSSTELPTTSSTSTTSSTELPTTSSTSTTSSNKPDSSTSMSSNSNMITETSIPSTTASDNQVTDSSQRNKALIGGLVGGIGGAAILAGAVAAGVWTKKYLDRQKGSSIEMGRM